MQGKNQNQINQNSNQLSVISVLGTHKPSPDHPGADLFSREGKHENFDR
jgi:hypothetical protein